MGLTQRFGLSWFGGSEPGSISDDGSKFTLDDRQLLDRVLAAYETHTHDRPDAGTRLEDPEAAPTATASTTGGTLEGGRTYYYSIGLVDQFGLETRISDEASVTTEAGPGTPDAPQGESQVGGTLAPGMYYYAVTALTPTGTETTLSPSTLVTVLDGEGSVLLQMPDKETGVAQFRVWRQRSGEAGFTKIGLASGLDFLDDGSVASDPCACDPGNLPPRRNQASLTNSVTVTLSAADAARIADPNTGIQSWRLYRSDVSGSYSADALVTEVVERTDPNDPASPLVTSWVDEGAPLLPGRPKLVSQTLTVPLESGGGGGGGGMVGVLTDVQGDRYLLELGAGGVLTTVPTQRPGPPGGPTFEITATVGSTHTVQITPPVLDGGATPGTYRVHLFTAGGELQVIEGVLDPGGSVVDVEGPGLMWVTVVNVVGESPPGEQVGTAAREVQLV